MWLELVLQMIRSWLVYVYFVVNLSLFRLSVRALFTLALPSTACLIYKILYKGTIPT